MADDLTIEDAVLAEIGDSSHTGMMHECVAEVFAALEQLGYSIVMEDG